MKRKIFLAITSAVIVFAVILAGCERLPSDDLSVNGDTSLTMTPSTLTIKTITAKSFTFTVAGGNGSYTWSLSNKQLGKLTADGDTGIYQNFTNSIGVNTINVLDTSGLTGIATITQE